MQRPLLALDADEAHLWYACPEQITATGPLEALLSSEERERWQRYHFAHDRQSFLVTRALVRTVLSRYAPVAPAAWRFAANDYGKPAIAGPVAMPLGFNISHTRGLTACLVAGQTDVGLDVEHPDRRPVTLGLAERYFAPAEVASLRQVRPKEFMARFLDFWTLKEAYIKGTGKGLSQPLTDFAFDIPPAGPVQIRFAPAMNDDPANWQFLRFELPSRHKVAVALRRTGQGDRRILIRPWSSDLAGPEA
jgi:4'-phosphopantetheinyl transferase